MVVGVATLAAASSLGPSELTVLGFAGLFLLGLSFVVGGVVGNPGCEITVLPNPCCRLTNTSIVCDHSGRPWTGLSTLSELDVLRRGRNLTREVGEREQARPATSRWPGGSWSQVFLLFDRLVEVVAEAVGGDDEEHLELAAVALVDAPI